MPRTAVSIAILLAASPALAQSRAPLPHRARLTYTAPSACPSEQTFRDLVAGQTSVNVFTPDAPARLIVALSRRGRGYEATTELRDQTGTVLQRRPFAPAHSCSGLVQEVALVISQQLDPHVSPEQPPPLPPPTEAPDSAPTPHPLEKKTTMPDPLLIVFGLGSTLGFGIAPRIAGGVSADVGIHWSLDAAPIDGVSVALGARWDPPAAGNVPGIAAGARVSVSRLLVTLAPCAHWWKVFGCAVGELGQIRGVGENIAFPIVEHGVYTAVGGRAGVEVPFAPHLGFRISGEVLGAVRPATFTIDERPAWAVPSVSGASGPGFSSFFDRRSISGPDRGGQPMSRRVG